MSCFRCNIWEHEGNHKETKYEKVWKCYQLFDSRPHKNLEETKAYLQYCLNAEYCWAITLKEDGEPIGAIDLVGINSIGVPEIGYVLMYDKWGKGIMTEAVKAVVEELFRNGYKKVGACHNIDNPASGRVMEKAGMKYVRSCMAQRKFGSDEQCEVRCYEISAE